MTGIRQFISSTLPSAKLVEGHHNMLQVRKEKSKIFRKKKRGRAHINSKQKDRGGENKVGEQEQFEC